MSSIDSAAFSSASNSTTQQAAEDDLDPAAFLKSVRELSEKREREDAERYRKLEEEVAQGRRDRAARRAERARSISPEKRKVISTKPLELSLDVQHTVQHTPALAAAMDAPPAPESPTKDIPVFKGFGSSSKSRTQPEETLTPSRSESSASIPSRNASSLARSGTLSWQQRPSSRGASSRPKSMFVPEATRDAPITTGATTDDIEPSRDQIAASLGSRDPSWFRQTADRGQGNAAYRKSKEESGSNDNVVSGRRGLPGMSRESSAEPTQGSPTRAESITSNVTSRTGSVRGSVTSSAAFSTIRSSTSSKPDLKSLIAADQEQEKLSPQSERTTSVTDGEQGAASRTMTMSSSQARLGGATDRPSSPTKGMGGFVQSAMMKRSDSVTKRWNAQPGPTLSRENSVASGRSGYGGLTGSYSMPKLEPTLGSRETSNEATSRPSSSSNNLTNMTATQAKDDKDVFVRPALPSNHGRSKSITSSYSTTAEEGHTSPPSSPSKRWSPSKSSWLESAITKPDSPKPLPAARNSQPSWMANIAKAKAQRASADSTTQPAEEVNSRPGSPTKAPFGQGILKRAESRDALTPRSLTPNVPEQPTSRSTSPTKPLSGQGSQNRSDSRDLGITSGPATPIVQPPEDISIAKRVDPRATMVEQIRRSEAGPEPSEKQVESEKLEPASASHPILDPKPATSTATAKSPPPAVTKPKPETPPKPQTDFRSTLRSRALTDTKQPDTPEFLAKFGNLKKTQTQNYVAPDVLKDNILRGKGELAKTGGPVKTQRRDELKESLLAKKDQWKKDKEEGIVHERKISNPPQTPQKPEALAKRELLGRSESVKVLVSPEKSKTMTPEALARHKSLREKLKPESQPLEAERHAIALASSTVTAVRPIGAKQPTETSKMAAKFNPGLASILARGPPATTTGSNEPSRTSSPGLADRTTTPMASSPSEPPAGGGQLQDMRKGRAKGPKRRKAGATSTESDLPATAAAETERGPMSSPTKESPPTLERQQSQEASAFMEKPKPRALPGSAASLMVASLGRSTASSAAAPRPEYAQSSSEDMAPSTSTMTTDKPSLPSIAGARSDNVHSIPRNSPAIQPKPVMHMPITTSTPLTPRNVPEFKGFGSAAQKTPSMRLVEDDKENAGDGSPSVKASASMWGKQPSPSKGAMPSQIQLPSKKDEEAAMRSAGLLASSPSRPGSSNGLGISPAGLNGAVEKVESSANAPPRPNKPSRAVSGQLQEASPNKGLESSAERPSNDIERRLKEAFGSVPRVSGPLSIDVHALITSSPRQDRVFKTARKIVYVATENGSLMQLQPQEEYIFFDECVYACHHTYSIANGPKKTEIFLWAGVSSTAGSFDQALVAVKKLAKEASNAFVHTVRQGMEPTGFLQALGGILITRRGSREGSSKQYMLCGRKHLGQIVFDEVDFGVHSLCSGYPYLLSYPITLQETKLYLWKGSACSTEELSAARLVSMDLSETGAIEVDDGVEFASFLKVFGHATTKASIPKPTELWQVKAASPDTFSCRLFAVRPEETKQGLFGGMFTRRPSWNSQSPSRQQSGEVKTTALEISPFTQTDLDVDGIYLLDAHYRIFILVGPMFASQPESIKDTLVGQTVSLASEYALTAASLEDRMAVPKGLVVLSGTPVEIKALFRHWDEKAGLWGTAGLMAGSQRQDQVEMLSLEDVLDIVCDD